MSFKIGQSVRKDVSEDVPDIVHTFRKPESRPATIFALACTGLIVLAFLALVVINLVSGFQALGTLLSVGLMFLPAGIARFWSRDISSMICVAVVAAILSGYAGLVLSFQTRVPSGPAIILVAAVLYVFSVLFGSVGGLLRQLFPSRHLEA